MKHNMKIKNSIGALLLTFLLGSCSIYSLQPLYTEKELIFDQQLLGTWIDADSNTWHFEKSMEQNSHDFEQFGVNPKTYTLTYTEGQHSAQLFVHVLQLENQLFVDLYPSDHYDEDIGNELLAAHLLPVHTFAKIDIGANELILQSFNGEWLEDLFEQNKIRISHEKIPYYGFTLRVLTASTSELQKFVTKYQHESDAFEELSQLTRKI